MATKAQEYYLFIPKVSGRQKIAGMNPIANKNVLTMHGREYGNLVKNPWKNGSDR